MSAPALVGPIDFALSAHSVWVRQMSLWRAPCRASITTVGTLKLGSQPLVGFQAGKVGGDSTCLLITGGDLCNSKQCRQREKVTALAVPA